MKKLFRNRGRHKRGNLLHIPSKGRDSRRKIRFSGDREQEWIHGISLCAVVLALCATAVGLAAVLGRIDISLQIRYLPRGKVRENQSVCGRRR